MTQSTVEILKKAKEHISDPAMWYRGGFSEDGARGVLASKPCCAYGAVVWAAGDVRATGIEGHPAHTALHILHRFVPDENRFLNSFGKPSIGIFNDHPNTTHADILALFDRAIADQEVQA